jgi:biopolymer transport protein ExbD
MIFYRKEKKGTGVDLSPLIDVVLSLVIFFILSTTFLHKHGMKLELPKSKTGEVAADTRILVTVDKGGSIFVAKTQVKEEELKSVLQDMLKTAQDKRIMLRADSKLEYGKIVKIMDIVRDSGANGLTIATVKEK